MGYVASKLNGGSPDQYIGSRSMLAMVGARAFDSSVSAESEKMVDEQESIMVLVEAQGVEQTLAAIDVCSSRGRWINKFESWIIAHGMDGFIIRG